MSVAEPARERLDWVDLAKGGTILLVVLVHGMGCVQLLELSVDGWVRLNLALQGVRMPLFFLLAGVFAKRWVDGGWRPLLIRKAGNYAYLYIVWTGVIVLSYWASEIALERNVLRTEYLWLLPVRPIATIWFMYALALCFVVTRALRGLPVRGQLVATGALAVVSRATFDWTDMDIHLWVATAQYLFFFVVGARCREAFLGIASRVSLRYLPFVLCVLVVLSAGPWYLDLERIPGEPLLVNVLGATCGVAVARLLCGRPGAGLLVAAGKKSLVIYLGHWPAMVALFTLLHPWRSTSALAAVAPVLPLLLTAGAVAIALAVHRVLGRLPGLYAMPARWMHASAGRTADVAAA